MKVRLAILGAIALAALGVWLNGTRTATKLGGQQRAEPFRIAGNFYYVGASDIAAFLITGPEGHVVLDAGYPSTVPMIVASIATLGFDIKDVRVLLNSEPHPDHGGGLAALQQASGAELWASEASADAIASGGDDPDFFLPMRALIRIGLFSYPAARVDHRFKDGETIRVGPIALTAHITAGHTRGCTSWSFAVRDGDRLLNVVSVCDPGVLGMLRLSSGARPGEGALVLRQRRRAADHRGRTADRRHRHRRYAGQRAELVGRGMRAPWADQRARAAAAAAGASAAGTRRALTI